MAKQVRTFTREDLHKMSDKQIRSLTDDEFWNAIEPEGVCPHCDPRLGRKPSGATHGGHNDERGFPVAEWRICGGSQLPRRVQQIK
jgi:hypothetical protein